MPVTSPHWFECQLYISGQDLIRPALPAEPGPRRVVSLRPVAFEQLTDPGFHRLLVALETLPQAA